LRNKPIKTKSSKRQRSVEYIAKVRLTNQIDWVKDWLIGLSPPAPFVLKQLLREVLESGNVPIYFWR